MKYLQILFLLIISNVSLVAQSKLYGIKGGLTVGSQRWNEGTTYNNSLLFRYHGDIFVENAPENNQSVLFAQLGLHTRGSAFRFRGGTAFDPVSLREVEVKGYTEPFVFNNVALILGAKRRGVANRPNAYYSVGLRVEYTVSTNLDKFDQNTIFYSAYPQNAFVRKFNYGLSIAGGWEMKISDLIGGVLEISVHPDISRQYFRGSFRAYDPYTKQYYNTTEQQIRNMTIEISLGLNFLRKVVYVD